MADSWKKFYPRQDPVVRSFQTQRPTQRFPLLNLRSFRRSSPHRLLQLRSLQPWSFELHYSLGRWKTQWSFQFQWSFQCSNGLSDGPATVSVDSAVDTWSLEIIGRSTQIVAPQMVAPIVSPMMVAPMVAPQVASTQVVPTQVAPTTVVPTAPHSAVVPPVDSA